MEEVCIRRENMGKSNTYDADSISVLEGLEAVRKRPGMYIGSVSTKGLNHLIYEIVDNAVDEHLAGFCKNIHVTLEKDGSATVEDDGRAFRWGCIRKESLRHVLYIRHCMQAENLTIVPIRRAEDWHGVGSSVVNALSVIWMCRSAERDIFTTTAMSAEFQWWIGGWTASNHRKDKKDRNQGQFFTGRYDF